MNAAKTTPAETPETPADEQVTPATPATIAEALDQVADGSRLAEGVDPEESAGRLAKVSKAVKSGLVRLTNLYGACADELAEIRSEILTPDGRPDWAGTTQTYNAFAVVAYESAFSDLSKADRKRVTDNVRNHMRLHSLEAKIRRYVANSITLSGDPMFPASAEIEKELADDPVKLTAERIEAHNGTEAFGAAIRREYKAAELAIPPRYQTPEDKQAAAGSGGGPGQGAPKSLDAVLKGVEGLKGVVHSMAVKGALRATSLVVSQLTSSGLNAIDGRPGIRDDFVRMNDLSTYAIKWLDGKTNEKDVESIASAFWGEDDTQAIQPTPDEQ